MTTLPADLERVLALSKKATQGEWVVDRFFCDGPKFTVKTAAGDIAPHTQCGKFMYMSEADAEFIVACVTTVRGMLDAARAQEAGQ